MHSVYIVKPALKPPVLSNHLHLNASFSDPVKGKYVQIYLY